MKCKEEIKIESTKKKEPDPKKKSEKKNPEKMEKTERINIGIKKNISFSFI